MLSFKQIYNITGKKEQNKSLIKLITFNTYSNTEALNINSAFYCFYFTFRLVISVEFE